MGLLGETNFLGGFWVAAKQVLKPRVTIPYPAEKPVSNTRGSPRAPSYFCGRRSINCRL